MSSLKSKHAFGAIENIGTALQNGLVDAYDILFLDGGQIGWIDKDGNVVMAEGKKQVLTVDQLPETGSEDILYICRGMFYYWDGANFVSPDGQGIDEATVDSKINTAVEDVKTVANAYTDERFETIESSLDDFVMKKYEISNTPVGTLVNYRDKEIRVMCPSDTVWTKQNVGATGNANMHYMAFKAYAPEKAVSFKEDDQETIVDNTMYYFENNDFAGVDADGRKYSVVWLALASYDEDSDKWSYFGEHSSTDRYIGWYYSVEWYDANGIMIASDRIRINLSNEQCHSAIEPYYISNALGNKFEEATAESKAYTDEQIALLSDSMNIVEF